MKKKLKIYYLNKKEGKKKWIKYSKYFCYLIGEKTNENIIKKEHQLIYNFKITKVINKICQTEINLNEFDFNECFEFYFLKDQNKIKDEIDEIKRLCGSNNFNIFFMDNNNWIKYK